MRKGIIDFIDFVNANMLGLNDIFPKSLIKVLNRLHRHRFLAVFDHDWLGCFFVVPPIERQKLLSWVFEFEVFEVRLYFS